MYVCGNTTYLEKSTDLKKFIDSGLLILKNCRVTEMGPGKLITFSDGSSLEFDTNVYCTGY